jgi:hypothetical protein
MAEESDKSEIKQIKTRAWKSEESEEFQLRILRKNAHNRLFYNNISLCQQTPDV